MNWHKVCDHCGNVVTAYTIVLNEGLVSAFIAFAEARVRLGRPVKKGELSLSHSQYGNFQKLRHFGLVEKRVGDGAGAWEMTDRGWNWLHNRCNVQTPAGQFGNVTLPPDHPAWETHEGVRRWVSILDVLPKEWRERLDYVAEKAGAA